MARPTKGNKMDRDASVIAGLRKHGSHLGKIPAELGGSIGSIVNRFQEHLDAMNEAERKEIAWRLALETEAQVELRLREFMARLKLFLQATLGQSHPILRDFGIKPYRRRRPSVATMALAVEKRRATRALRETKGKKQRKRIKGGTR